MTIRFGWVFIRLILLIISLELSGTDLEMIVTYNENRNARQLQIYLLSN